ncbi:substrate-specific component FolT of folate ECF transporter [Mesomycoplasma lagogenitalium]|uniref:Substrate-specific component FolT of folate ECF transporter n=1 Tax=Mesomycoplasma lagogenitalium TaxID=171286 RepID=A0ABY8LWZ1_9BACT|nr:substrate-specific component FolT of folate ECF transporter [Mesomycoplasma lagogenitalium]WGI36776.1 substrate-specific component FolT of folate ECF transporter [Mesomycoplasma lagogenitalium]
MKRWNSRTIAFVAVFMSISTIMLLLGIRLFPLAILPNIRFSIIGLPIKITGFIFGPIVGFLTGFLSDLISLQFAPSTYSVYYTISLAITGIIPGMVSWLFFDIIKKRFNEEYLQKKYEEKVNFNLTKLTALNLKLTTLSISDSNEKVKISQKIQKISKKINRLNKKSLETRLYNLMLLSCWILLILIMTIIISIIYAAPDSAFENSKFIKNKTSFLILMLSGTSSMLIFITIARFLKFFKSKDRFSTMVPIIVFSAILEPISSSILSLGDVQSGTFPTFEIALISHFIVSPVKIWVNLFVIYLTSLIIIPIVKNKTKNSY